MRLPAEIPLTQGRYALVDEEDFDLLMQYNWQCRDGYAKRCNYPSKKPISMQCQLMNPPDGYVVDHINGDGLDNRRSNLRICKQRQNMWNRKAVTGSASKYKGVDWYAASGSWRAYIKIDGKQKHLGCYRNEDDAARAYNKAAKEVHGEFARLNPVDGEPAPRIVHPTVFGKRSHKDVRVT